MVQDLSGGSFGNMDLSGMIPYDNSAPQAGKKMTQNNRIWEMLLPYPPKIVQIPYLPYPL